MKQAILTHFPHLNLSVVAMVIFLAVFLGWCLWTFAPKRKGHFDQMSNLPLED